MSEAPVQQQRIGHYLIEAPLGRGAMGAVFLARDERIGRRVALKQLQIKADFEDASGAAEYYKRLQREAEVCGALQHPNIVTLYDVGYEHDRISYLALEYVAGETLLERVKRDRPKPLPVQEALSIAADILRGLAYAHSKGIVHRDIKPANILIGRDGVAKIADFGIARPQQSSMTAAGALMGTPNYMPPEQVRGTPATPRSDLFSLGVLLFEMVTGTKPFASSEMASTLENIVRKPTPLAAATNPDVSPELDAIIQRLTAKDPQERFATADEALQAIEQIRAGMPVAVKPSTAEERTVAVGDRSVSPLLRPLPLPTFFAIVFVAAAIAVTPSLVIWSRIDDTPTVSIPAAQLAEFASKREALRAADELFRKGRYTESLAAYESHLAKYPQSVVAREGVERSREAIANEKAARAKKPAKRQDTTVMQDIRRSVRRLFGGK